MTSPHLEYRAELGRGRLTYQRCDACQLAVFPPRLVCPACGGQGLRRETSGGTGVVYSATAVAQRDCEPHSVVLVDLDEGFRMMSTVTGIPAEQVRIGLRVQVAVDHAGDRPRPTFRVEERPA